ncbi:MAG: sugar phosphate isomerase/epimerase [Acidobacteriota bacterium]
MDLTRRDFHKLALGSVAATATAATTMSGLTAAAQVTKPNSVFGGVQIGVIAPYSFMNEVTDVDSILTHVVRLGISAVELQSSVIEGFAGAPGLAPATGRGGRGGRAGAAPAPAATTPAPATATPAPPSTTDATTTQARTLTPEQQTADTLRRWRLMQAMTKYRDLKKKFDDAGVAIQIVKFDLGPTFVDEEIDYCFQVAKTLGARAITCEPPVRETKRLGLFADKHQLMLGFHGHSDVTGVDAFGRPGAWEQAFFYSKFNGANIDIGHFTAGNNRSPLAFIREYHDRITNIHLKDRRMNQGPNVPWGEGDTEIREILQLMKREKYPFQATIELEYPVPAGSTRVAEIAKCLAFCKDALL